MKTESVAGQEDILAETNPDRVEKAGFCSLCRSRCGTINVVERGRLVEVRPSPAHPTGQAVCPKGRAAPEIAHSARRLKYPLRRTQPKTAADPGWVRISWDEALTEIADRLKHYRAASGAETVAFSITSQSSSAISDGTEWVQRFLRLYGSPNNCMAVELCNWHKDYSHAFTFGCGLPTPDYANSDLIVLWGHDPANSWLAQANAIMEAKGRGARLMVVDPHRSGSVLAADLWCRIRPGTDGALALGIARQLIEAGRFDHDFIAHWSNGPFLVRDDSGRFLRGIDLGWEGEAANDYAVWDPHTGEPRSALDTAVEPALRGSYDVATVSGVRHCRPAFQHYVDACEPYTPERVAQISWIEAHEVTAMAQAYMDAKSVCYYGWNGIAQHTNATQTDRAIALLHALTGSFDAPGGNVLFTKHPSRNVNNVGLLGDQKSKALGLDERPLGPPSLGWVTSRDLYTAILEGRPYPIKALIGFGSNIVVSHPEPERAVAALQALEFHVHCDPFMNPTAQFADIVLPVSSPWERESLRIGFEITQSAEELIQLRQRMIEPTGESRSDMSIVFDLACRLGLDDAFFHGDIDSAWNYVLDPIGVTVEELRRRPEGIRKPLTQEHRKYRRTGFATETARVEIYSELFFRHGQPPVPIYVDPAETPSDAYPFVLTTGNRGNFRHSQDRGIVSLRRRSPYPEVIIHPEAADAKGVEMGGWVTLRTRIGEAKMRVRIDDTVHPCVVVADYGFWQDCPDLGLAGGRSDKPLDGNYNNMITSQAFDPVSGALALRSFACDLEQSTAGAWSDFRPFVVRSRSEEADGIVTLDLIPQDGSLVPPFHPGQHITVRFAQAVRSYSLSSGAQKSPRGYQITVKRDGEVSRIINDDIRAGDVIEARAPAGHFVIPQKNEFPIVLVAAGIGITPFISYLRSLTGSPQEPRVVLYYCDRDQAQRAFTEELSVIKERIPNLTVVHHLTRPRGGDLYDRAGRITAADIPDDLIDARARFYLCGPVSMMESLTRGLLDRGVMKFEIFKEQFQATNTSIDAAAGPFELRFASSKKSVLWTPSCGTILDCAERAGIALTAGCRVGQCESCSLAIIDGKVQHLVELADPESESCLTCQAIPTSNLILDA